jgi:hypothetical protein
MHVSYSYVNEALCRTGVVALRKQGSLLGTVKFDAAEPAQPWR